MTPRDPYYAPERRTPIRRAAGAVASLLGGLLLFGVLAVLAVIILVIAIL